MRSNHKVKLLTYKVCLALHQMNVNLEDKASKLFVNAFVTTQLTNKFPCNYVANTLHSNLYSGNVRLLKSKNTTDDFDRIYNLITDDQAYEFANQLFKVKHYMFNLIAEDLIQWVKYTSFDIFLENELVLEMLKKLVVIDVLNPHKIDFVTAEFHDHELKSLYNANEELYNALFVNYTESNHYENFISGKYTIGLKPNIEMVLKTHFKSKNHLPKNLHERYDYLKNNLQENLYIKKSLTYFLQGSIIILPKNIKSFFLDGVEYQKSDITTTFENDIEKILVNDNLKVLNNDYYSKFRIFLLDQGGALIEYNSKKGEYQESDFKISTDDIIYVESN